MLITLAVVLILIFSAITWAIRMYEWWMKMRLSQTAKRSRLWLIQVSSVFYSFLLLTFYRDSMDSEHCYTPKLGKVERLTPLLYIWVYFFCHRKANQECHTLVDFYSISESKSGWHKWKTYVTCSHSLFQHIHRSPQERNWLKINWELVLIVQVHR